MTCLLIFVVGPIKKGEPSSVVGIKPKSTRAGHDQATGRHVGLAGGPLPGCTAFPTQGVE